MHILLHVLAGLILFLFSVFQLSELLHKLLGSKASYWIERATSLGLGSLLVGFVATTLLDSSSAVIIITIVLVNSGKMTLRQAMGVVLGANIGTTVSSQVIASDLGVFAPVVLLAGMLMYMVMRGQKRKNTGLVIFYFGLLFFGLHTMENAVEPLRDQPFFYELMKHNENPLKGSLVGALVTLVIQSSSATVGMAIVLTKKGLLSLAGGVAVMMGAELGTCADTLLATIRGSRQAIKTGLFHLTFNLLSIGLGLIMFQPFTRLVQWVSADAPAERGLANAHVLFNLCGVVVFVWAIPLFEKALNLILPEKNTALLTQEGKSG